MPVQRRPALGRSAVRRVRGRLLGHAVQHPMRLRRPRQLRAVHGPVQLLPVGHGRVLGWGQVHGVRRWVHWPALHADQRRGQLVRIGAERGRGAGAWNSGIRGCGQRQRLHFLRVGADCRVPPNRCECGARAGDKHQLRRAHSVSLCGRRGGRRVDVRAENWAPAQARDCRDQLLVGRDSTLDKRGASTNARCVQSGSCAWGVGPRSRGAVGGQQHEHDRKRDGRTDASSRSGGVLRGL